MVLMFHAESLTRDRIPTVLQVPIFHQGHGGVQFFMVISGLILAIIAFQRDISVPHFYANRALRIYPLMIAIVSLGYFASPGSKSPGVAIDYLVALTPISNIPRNHAIYGDFGGHLWSIAVELQFYLIFPFIALAVGRTGERFIYRLIGVLLAVRVAVYLMTGSSHHLSYLTIVGNLDCFLIGMLAGRLYMSKPAWRFGWWVPVLVLVAINAVVQVLFSHRPFFALDYAGVSTNGISNSKLWIVWPTIQGAMWAAFALTFLRSNLWVPFPRTIARFGMYSYSLYGWHILVLFILLKFPALVAAFGGVPLISGYAFGLLTLAISLCVSAASYHVIEAPFLAMRVQYAKARPE